MGGHMKRSHRRKSRRSRKHRRGGKIPMGPIKSAKSMTMGAKKAASKGEAMAKSATKMCANIPNMFLKADCEKRVKKAADAAKAKMEDAKKQMNVAEQKLTGVKAKAAEIQKKIDSGAAGAVSPIAGGKRRRRRTKRRRKKRKSKKSRRKSRKTKRRRKSKKRRSRRRR